MSKVVRKITLYLVSALCMLCLVVGGVNALSLTAKAETTTVNLTYKSMQYQNNAENAGSYWTSICFTPDTGDGVSTGNPNGAIAADFSDLLANTTYSGSDNTVIYTPACHWGWTMDFKSSTFCFIYLRTVNAPAVGDTVQMKKGAWFVTGGSIDDKYVLAEDINLKFNGATWEVYVPSTEAPAETVETTFTHINSTWNDNTDILNNGRHYTVLHLSGLQTSGYLGQGDDWSEMLANATINGGASYFSFSSASYIAGPDAACDFIIIYSATEPTTGDEFVVKAGATFKVGGDDTNVYKLANDICLKYNGTAWEVFVPSTEAPAETVETTFTHINSTWNDNTDILNNGRHYTVLHLSGLQTSGYLGQGDDWSEMLANATINGGASYFSFSSASYIAGPDAACDFIIIYSATEPTTGDEFVVKAGATFKVGGDDTNVYKLANDICLKYNGTAWEIFENTEEPPVDPNPPVVEPTVAKVSYTSIHRDWNNYDYVDQGYYCTLIYFSGDIGGGSHTGDYSDLLSKATLNGQPLDTENVSFMCAKWIGTSGGIVLRFKTLPQEKSILTLPAGATFTVGGEDTNVYEIAESVELKMMNGKWSVPLPTADFSEVNPWNNNIVTVSGNRLTLLDFNVENLGNVVSSDKNLVAMAGVSINGVKLTEIEGASITYMHGANHMGIELPMEAIYPTENYPISILKVEEGTVFENYELPEITLSLIGGTWVVGEYEMMPEEDTYVTISDIVGEDRMEIGAEGSIAAASGFEGDVSLKFVYRSEEAIVNYVPYGGLAVYVNSTNNWDGWRIFFVANKVYVYDATMGGIGDQHVLLGEADFGIASSFEMQIEISVKQTAGKYSIVIGGSCAKILEINDITPIGTYIGGGISIYSATRSCSVKDYKYGDVFDPVLTINSKQEIVLNEGDAVPEIDVTAMDGLTEITPTYAWDDGAVTDGKMNAGVWNCIVTAMDANGNYSTAIIRVTVKGEPKYTVTFDDKGDAEYGYGEKIVKPADPTKEATAKVQYTFDGWYVGDVKWDFDNDIVTADVVLVAKFVESDVYYKVTVTLAGEETQTIYVTYGAQIDLSVFDKEGFATEVKKGGEVINSLVVTEDTAIEISYTASNAEDTEGGCGGCNGSLAGLGGIGALLTAVGGCMLIRKKEDADEE